MTDTSPDVLEGGTWVRDPALHVMTWRPDPIVIEPPPRLNTCGTAWGARLHRRAKTPVCNECREAERLQKAEHRRRKVLASFGRAANDHRTTPTPPTTAPREDMR